MGNFRKNIKKASKATKSVDIAQNALMKRMKSKLDELEAVVETKYSLTDSSFRVASYDGDTSITRARNIFEVRMGENVGMGDFNQRIGDQITLKHIDFNYRIELSPPLNSQIVANQTTIRVVMFWDNMPSAVSAAGGTIQNLVEYPQLFQTAQAGATGDPAKYQMMLTEKDWDNRHRFSIIYDKTHTLCPNTDAITSQGLSGLLGSRSCIGVQKVNKNYKKQKIRFQAGGSTVTNRKLYFCALSDVSNEVNNNPYTVPVLFHNIRALYEDA